ncbi:MAG TPA: hypothetical protein VIM98_01760 [Dyella sp.]|uniref:hypothetical protein n=1 Tax=Dyella sp. TaxID=1869338 RepID=UPI002F938C8B
MAYIIPVRLRALVVNRVVRSAEVFNRWVPTFNPMLQRMHDGEPVPEQSMEDLAPFNYFEGVHVQWELPEALTQGSFSAGEDSQFPLIPNRWLVVRYASRPGIADPNATAMRAWVVHSDHLQSDDPAKPGTSPFITPPSRVSTPQFDLVGRSQDITTNPWTEPTHGKPPFLTAMGPGLPSFAAFEPYHRNVLSFHDTLAGLPTNSNGIVENHRLSYLVVGWYHDAAIDIVNQAKTIPGLLPPDLPANPAIADIFAALGWHTERPDQGTSADTLYSGRALGVVWEYAGRAPPSRRPNREQITVYVGNNTDDILQQGVDADLADLFLGMLENSDTPGSGSDSARTSFNTGFLPSHGGYRWFIDVRTDDNDEDTPPPVNPVWLTTLNQDQAAYDAQRHRTQLLRERVDTFKYLRALPVDRRPDGYGTAFDPRLNEQLDVNRSGSAANQLRAAEIEEQRLKDLVPTGEGEDLEALAREYAIKQGLDTDRYLLHRQPDDEYYAADDPVIAIGGSGYDPAEGPRDENLSLPLRSHDALVTGLRVGSTWIATREGYPRPNVSGLKFSAPVIELIKEFDLMHRVSNTPGAIETIAQGAIPSDWARGPLPEYFGAWQQPWTPMFVSWRLHYFATPYQSGTTLHWSHQIANRTMRLQWNGTGAEPGDGEGGLDQHTFRGRGYINPTFSLVARAQLRRYRSTYGLEGDRGLDNVDIALRETDFLSQRLSGFNDWLLQRSGAAMPDTLIDTDFSPDPIRTTAQSRFRVVRAGQITFVSLRIVDRFGRSAVIVSPLQRGPLHFFPERAPDVVPNRPLYPDATDLHRFIQLSPRILCDARVEFSTRNTTRSLDGIIGWLLVNRLDRSIAVYTATGQPLGALRATFENLIALIPLPHTPYRYTDADFATRFPDLRNFLNALIGSSATRLTRLTELFEQAEQHMVDGTETDDSAPVNLIGRPYALVTASAALKLRQPAPRNPSWETVLEPPEPDLTRDPHTYRAWLGRVGDELSDGLVGYFTSTSATNQTVNYARLFAAAFPQIPTVDYIQPPSTDTITRLAATTGDAARHLTLLVNPHLVARAHTGVLPTAELTLNTNAVSYALFHIQAAFLATPLLTTMAVSTDDPPEITVTSTYPGTDDDPVGNLIDGNPNTSYVSRDLITAPAVITLAPLIASTLHNVHIAWDTRFAADDIRITVRHIDVTGKVTPLLSDYTPGPEPRSILGGIDLAPLRELTLTVSGQNRRIALTGVELLTEALAARNQLLTYPPDARHGSYEWAAPNESTGEHPHWTRQPLAPADITPHPDQIMPTAYSGYLLLTPPYARLTGELIATSAWVHRNQNPDSVRYHYRGFGTPGAVIQVLHKDGLWKTPGEPTSQTLVESDGSFEALNTAYGSGAAIAEIRQRREGIASAVASIRYTLEVELRLTEAARRSYSNEWHRYSYAGTGTRGADIEALTTAGTWKTLGRVNANGEFALTEANIPWNDRDFSTATLRQRIDAVISTSVSMPYTVEEAFSLQSALVHNESNTRRFHYTGFGTPFAIIEVLHSNNEWITPDAPGKQTLVNEDGSFEAKESPYGASTRADARVRQAVDGVASDPITRLYEFETALHLSEAARQPSPAENQQWYLYRGTGTRGAVIEVLMTTGAWKNVGSIDSSGKFNLTESNVPTQERDLDTATIRQRINAIISLPVSKEYDIRPELSVSLAATYTLDDTALFIYNLKGRPNAFIQVDRNENLLGQLDSNGWLTINNTTVGNLTPTVRFMQLDGQEPQVWVSANYTLRDPLSISRATRSADGTSFEYEGFGTPGAELSVQISHGNFGTVGVIGSSGRFSFTSNIGSSDAMAVAYQSIRNIHSPYIECPYSDPIDLQPPRILTADMFMQGAQVRYRYRGTGTPYAHIQIRLGSGQWSSLQSSGPTLVDQSGEFRVDNTEIHVTGGIAEMRQVMDGMESDPARLQYTTQGISILSAQTAPGRTPGTLIYTQFGFTPGLEVELKGHREWRRMSFQGTNWGVGDFESTPSEFDPATATIRGIVASGLYTPELTVPRITRTGDTPPSKPHEDPEE